MVLLAVIFAAEIGDVYRFDTPRRLGSFLAWFAARARLAKVRRSGLTLAFNRQARRVPVEAASSYRHPARVSETMWPLQRRFATSPGRPRSNWAADIAGSTWQARDYPSS
jgi:hypothetical protein